MKKKKFDLRSDIVEVKAETVDNGGETTAFVDNRQIKNQKSNIHMTLAVEATVRNEYKAWCAKNNLQMSEAFLKAFDLLKLYYKN